MADCPNCKAFIIRMMSKDAEWLKKASFEELENADAETITYHCPKCKRTSYVIALIPPK